MKLNRYLLTVSLAFAAMSPGIAVNVQPTETGFLYRDTVRNDVNPANNTPVFVVYPDSRVDSLQAASLVDELGILPLTEGLSVAVNIVNPVGQKYDNEKDFAAYQELINKMRIITNLKVVGIGNGATFVNNVVARNAYEVAGIFTYGGKMTGGKKAAAPVPAYIALGNTSIAANYAAINNVRQTKRDDGHVYYVHADEPLLQVVVGTDKKQTLKEAMADAWQTVLSRNYRYSNYKHTFYMGATFGQYGAYELEPFTDMKTLGLRRIPVRKTINEPVIPSVGEFFWYEYTSDETDKARPGTLPLVVLLHGNMNDNRTQSETTGWMEIAAREKLMVIEIEWQGAGRGNAPHSDMFIGLDGIEEVVYDVLSRYPQIDKSRIYVEGCSAGSMASAASGIQKSHLYAAVGCHSGGIFNKVAYGFSYKTLYDQALQKRGFVQTPVFLVTGTDDDTIPFPTEQEAEGNPFLNLIHIYQTLNGMEASSIDFKANPLWGIELQNVHEIKTNKHINMQTGFFHKDGVPLMQVSAIEHYGHWNFRPAAEEMWKFFKHFSRDVETKKLVYTE